MDTQVPQVYGTRQSLPISPYSVLPCYSSQGVHSSGQGIEDSLESVSNRFLVHHDWLNRADSYNQSAESTQTLIKRTQLLGWMINVNKSELNPTQILIFLGYKFDLLKGAVS